MLLLVGALALATTGIWYTTRPIDPAAGPPTGLNADHLDPERQVIWVRADTLRRLLNDLKATQPGVFDYRLNTDRLELRCATGAEKSFNKLFLDDEYLSRFDKIRDAPVEKLPTGYGFALTVQKKRGTACVRLPAEVLQSLMVQQ